MTHRDVLPLPHPPLPPGGGSCPLMRCPGKGLHPRRPRAGVGTVARVGLGVTAPEPRGARPRPRSPPAPVLVARGLAPVAPVRGVL